MFARARSLTTVVAALLIGGSALAPQAVAASRAPVVAVQDIPSLAGVAQATCPASGVCYAVGYSGSPRNSNSWKPLLEQLRAGAWASVPLNVSVAAHGVAIACSAVGECGAVVSGVSNGIPQNQYLETLHAGAWTQRALPATADWTAIACPAALRCTLAGTVHASGRAAFLTVQGASLTARPFTVTPNAGATDNPAIAGITCAGPDWCATWGTNFNGTVSVAFAAAIDHGTVATATVPTPGGPAGTTRSAEVDQVLCPVAGSCTGYGTYYQSDGTARPARFVLRNGVVSASTVPVVQDPTPGAPQQVNVPVRPTCTAIGSCVGIADDLNDGSVAFIDTLKSDGWHARAITRNSGDLNVTLNAVACTTGEHCYVAGTRAARGPIGDPVFTPFAVLPDGSQATIPGTDGQTSIVAGPAVCAPGTGFCAEFPYYGDFSSGSTYTTYSVTITE